MPKRHALSTANRRKSNAFDGTPLTSMALHARLLRRHHALKAPVLWHITTFRPLCMHRSSPRLGTLRAPALAVRFTVPLAQKARCLARASSTVPRGARDAQCDRCSTLVGAAPRTKSEDHRTRDGQASRRVSRDVSNVPNVRAAHQWPASPRCGASSLAEDARRATFLPLQHDGVASSPRLRARGASRRCQSSQDARMLGRAQIVCPSGKGMLRPPASASRTNRATSMSSMKLAAESPARIRLAGCGRPIA